MKRIPIPNRFLFQLALPCRHVTGLESRTSPLDVECQIPDFAALEEGAEENDRLRVRAAWCDGGLRFEFFISGKTRQIWCNPNRPDESDRVELWLDTRNVRDAHRATRFCHRFVCLPQGGGRNGDEAVLLQLPINRARQQPSEIAPSMLKARSRLERGGYSVSFFLPARVLTGFDPREFRQMGVAWMVVDRDLGVRTLTAGAPFPFQEDPSLWYTMNLSESVEAEAAQP